jgi:hypothetical protein
MINRILVTASLLLVCACAPQIKSAPVAPPLTQEQMQSNLKAAGELRPEHAVFKTLAGKWRTETKIWMDPSAAPEVSKGTATSELLYGGRYLAMDYKGTFMGQPFQGQGNMGFDNVSGKYFSTWIDSVSTMLMHSEGKASPDGRIVLASAITCPVTRESMNGEEVLTIVDKNKYLFEAFQIRGNERVKAMEITYSRAK